MIQVSNIFHSYANNEQYQVNDVSFEVREGEIFGFLGPNGAGKSTIQKIITGLLPLQRGTVQVADCDIRRSTRQLFNRIGVAFEQPNVYARLTGLENLAFFRGLYDVPTAEPMELLHMFGIADAARKKVGTYSKGMKQRLVLARSLINQPGIWFLDEPTSGLDPTTTQEIKSIIRGKQAEGKTIFLTTHNMHIAEELCDRVAFIDAGKIKALDTPRNLKLRFGEQRLKVEYRSNGKVDAAWLSLTAEADRGRLLHLLEGGQVETIHSQEASLDAVFIAVTGKELR